MRSAPLLLAARNRGITTIKTLGILGIFGFSVAASGAGSVTGTITSIETTTGDFGMVFVSVNVAKTNNPACATNGVWAFVLSLPASSSFYNQMFAVLLSARATQTPVSIFGSGACDVYPNVETLVGISY